MERIGIVALCVLGLAAGAAGADGKDEKARGLQDLRTGTWRAVEIHNEKGVRVPNRIVELVDVKLSFGADGKLTNRSQNQTRISKYTADPSRSPWQIEILRIDTPGNKPGKGIFKIDGDTMTLCLGKDGSDKRPTEFKPQIGATYMILKRIK